MPVVNSEFTVKTRSGLILTSRSRTPVQNGRNPSWRPLSLLVLLQKRLQSKPSSPTLPSVNALEFNSRKTTRELLPTYLVMVVCPLQTKTTKSSLPVSVVLDMLRVIFLEFVSRLSRQLVAVFLPSGSERRRSLSTELNLSQKI